MLSLRSRLSAAILTTVLAVPGAALALNAGEKVDNFRLLDHRGEAHELYYLSDMKGVVLIAHGNSCATESSAAASLEALRTKYQDQGIEFLLVDSNLGESREAIVQAAAKAGLKAPILIDDTQLIGESLGFMRNGEALLVNPQNWQVTYHGTVATHGTDNIAAAIESTLAGKPAVASATESKDCAIKMPERDKRAAHAQISYEKAIAPMLIEKCVTCHREGGIGPWQMSSYTMVKGFSPMIREVLRTKRMPPWHADPHYGVFSNSRGLTDVQTKQLVHWIEAGSPRGTGNDPLESFKKTWPKWPLGEPDLVVEMPAFTTPASGVIPYQMVKVTNPLDHDVWIRAIDFLPGERRVLHHIIASVGSEGFGSISLNNYVPGAQPLEMPKDTGILLPAKSTFHFQAHYTPNGQSLTDVTRMGLYFMKDTPKYSYRSLIFIQPFLKIPANTKSHTESATQTFKADAVIYSLHPHSHFRGKSASFVAKYPDGREETLLNVPNYDFNWQSTYELTTPLPVPAGTKIVYTTVFDNSVQNKANPDPNRLVKWGEQSWDEMVFGVVRYRNVKEDSADTQPAGPSVEELFGGKPQKTSSAP